jgi:ABC-type uncharacterized transport system ATPase subunit
MLELRNITKTFGNVVANNDVSMNIEKGTIHAIVGENGAGKSTAMRIAYGFYTADGGDILVDGEVRRIATPHDAIALGVGMVHQHFMLVETMTVAKTSCSARRRAESRRSIWARPPRRFARSRRVQAVGRSERDDREICRSGSSSAWSC